MVVNLVNPGGTLFKLVPLKSSLPIGVVAAMFAMMVPILSSPIFLPAQLMSRCPTRPV